MSEEYSVGYSEGYQAGWNAAQKTFVGLTDEEVQWIYDNGRTPAGMIDMAEAKLKEKNHHG